MVHYPRYRRQSVLAVCGYYGFLCLDSLITLQENLQGSRDYPLMMLLLFFLSVLLLVIHGSLTLRESSNQKDAGT